MKPAPFRSDRPTIVPHALLPDIIECMGGAVHERLAFGTDTLTGQIVVQGDTAARPPAIDAHFVGVQLDGTTCGTVRTEGSLNGEAYQGERGRISFVPMGRAPEIDVRGASASLQITLDPELMAATMRELLRRGGEGAELLGFNTLIAPQIEHLLLAMAQLGSRAPEDDAVEANRLEADVLAQRLATALVRDFATAPLAERTGEPMLSTAQMVRAIELLDACVASALSLARLAAAVELPEGYFVAAFENETGLAPHEFLRERRVDRAREWLDARSGTNGGEICIDTLARLCGFADAPALDIAFSAQVGRGVEAYRAGRQ